MGVGAGLYMYGVVVKNHAAISSPDEFLVAINAFIYDTPVYKKQRGVTMATNSGK